MLTHSTRTHTHTHTEGPLHTVYMTCIQELCCPSVLVYTEARVSLEEERQHVTMYSTMKQNRAAGLNSPWEYLLKLNL